MSIYDVFNGGSRPFNKEEWAAAKQAQRQEAYEMIDNTCAEMMKSGDSFRQYLDVQGRFDRYSVNNAILVSAQMPEATQLKERAAWKQSRVYVNKDAQKVVILVHTDDYILEDGQHEGIVSEELWQKVHAKRMATGIKQPSKVGKDRSHLLTGVLKCPLCGSSMYTNKHAWTNKDGTYKEVYYYICGRNKQERGHHCDYKASLRKTDIEPLVVEAVKELVSDAYFAKEIEKRIGVQTDTSTVDKELANYENKLKEVDLNKARLENEIDNLPADARFRERKIHDMTLRLDALYDTMVELEERIEDGKLRKSSIEMEAITLDNVYKIMQNFGKLYDIMSDDEKKSLITYLIKGIQIYPNGESEMPLKSIEFNFPIYIDGKEVRKVLWEKGNTVETVCALSKLDIHQKITVDLKMDELDVTAAETKATYEEIREYVKEHTGLNVSDLYIAQVKQKCGIKERQNYNKPKAENPKRLKCPAEKERAIREALKYFKMI